MPVDKRAVGIVFPRPYVQGVERGQAETVGGFEIVEELSHQLRWPLLFLVPRIGENDEIGSDQAEAAVGLRFVDDNRWPCRVEFVERQ